MSHFYFLSRSVERAVPCHCGTSWLCARVHTNGCPFELGMVGASPTRMCFAMCTIPGACGVAPGILGTPCNASHATQTRALGIDSQTHEPRSRVSMIPVDVSCIGRRLESLDCAAAVVGTGCSWIHNRRHLRPSSSICSNSRNYFLEISWWTFCSFIDSI